ncbi:peroxiredoxin [Guillardia theta CCMP2712]|uniref:thioredoxin-dependent peroxiredoxin n=2 Tax=Guillardia theta TaxID=55529 RepID=L1J8E5_GUITC|nr:peroxiredoxin [Guillardia theta CCMP2712]EKX44374.1 peroxiredoxin [Guillardia theta CCMP2712]|eukprot:XP_005831354.1 peroxiredoxin [Guillardia theta CCMP2712]
MHARCLFVLPLIASSSAFLVSPSLPSVSPSSRLASLPRSRVTASLLSDEISGLSRRDFFKDTSAMAGVSAITIGTLGFEVPSSFAEGLPSVNAPAPDFLLPSNEGKDIGLKDLKGKWTVLYFYPGDFTSGCTIEANNFEKASADIRALGAEIVGVSVDSVEKHLDFAKKYGLSFPLLSDQGGKVSQLYGSALQIPFMGSFSNRQTYIIDPSGNLRWVFTDVQSRLNKHADEVIAKLKELKA